MSFFWLLNFVSVSTDISCRLSWCLHSADCDSGSDNEPCETRIQLGWDQEFICVKHPFMLAQASCDSTEKAILDWEAIHPKHCEMAVWELPNSRKKAHLISKRWKVTARWTFSCSTCNRRYCYKMSLIRHLKCGCGKEPSWGCLYCSYAGLYKPAYRDMLGNAKRACLMFCKTVLHHVFWLFLTIVCNMEVKCSNRYLSGHCFNASWEGGSSYVVLPCLLVSNKTSHFTELSAHEF